MRIFLCGDVMLGRGIDQILPSPCDPELHEGGTTSALDYVRLAEARNGAIARSVAPDYVWGAALDEFTRLRPDARIINLETSITRSDDYAPKGINYRMSPENADCLVPAGIDCCALANNHVLDWGSAGLMETLAVLHRLGIRSAGAGRRLDEAMNPAVVEVAGKARVLVCSFAMTSSGTPRRWAAAEDAPGVNLLPLDTDDAIALVDASLRRVRRSGDIVIVSIHWGPNWGYDIGAAQQKLAHALIERLGVAIVHGHSSHHPKAVEVHRDRLILYGCGDFLNDYEGIRGYEEYRGDLVLMYFADLDRDGRLIGLTLVPLQIQRFRLVRPSQDDIAWMRGVMAQECSRFGLQVAQAEDSHLQVSWPRSPSA